MAFKAFRALTALTALLLALVPAAASAQTPSPPESEVVELLLTPVAVDGGFEVSLEVVGASLTLTFQLNEEGEVWIVGVSGLPEGAQTEIEGSGIEITLEDGTEAEIELGNVVVDEQGQPTAVTATVKQEEEDEDDQVDADDTEDTDNGDDTGGTGDTD